MVLKIRLKHIGLFIVILGDCIDDITDCIIGGEIKIIPFLSFILTLSLIKRNSMVTIHQMDGEHFFLFSFIKFSLSNNEIFHNSTMSQIRTIIVDDEPAAISNLKWELENFCEDVEVIDSFTSPVEAISGINYLKPDCVFLDIEMPEKDGFTLLSELKFKKFQLIITTAYENYALQAFRENAIDYLLKPVDTDELKNAVEKIKSMKGTVDLSDQIRKVLQTNIHQPSTSQKISFAVDGKILLVKPSEILYCKSDGNYTEIYQAEKKVIVVSKNLKEVERKINHPNFLRIHNSYLVNTDFIMEYIKGDGGFVMMEDQTKIAVSRSKKNDLMQKIINT